MPNDREFACSDFVRIVNSRHDMCGFSGEIIIIGDDDGFITIEIEEDRYVDYLCPSDLELIGGDGYD